MTRLQFRPTGLAILMCLSLPLSAMAADDPVVATVDGTEILRSDVIDAQQRLPAGAQGISLDTVFELLVNSLIDTKLAAGEARKQGVQNDVDIKRLMNKIEEQILERALLSRYIEERVTDEALQEQYQLLVKEQSTKQETKARHILVENEGKALEIIAELDKGADFAELAKANSTGPSASEGGELGYFTKESMVPPFADAAFSLEKGAYSKKPVQTQFGWHVIMVEDRRSVEPPTFEASVETLRNELSRKIGLEYLEELRKAAKIVRFKPDGSPLDK